MSTGVQSGMYAMRARAPYIRFLFFPTLSITLSLSLFFSNENCCM